MKHRVTLQNLHPSMAYSFIIYIGEVSSIWSLNENYGIKLLSREFR